MTVEELLNKPAIGLFLGALTAVLGGRGLFGWFSARAQAEPEKLEQHVQMMKVAFDKMELELDRADKRDVQRLAELAAMREEITKGAEERHKLRNALLSARGFSNQLALYARALVETLVAAGIEPLSAKPYGEEIERLMSGPVALYTPDDPRGNTSAR